MNPKQFATLSEREIIGEYFIHMAQRNEHERVGAMVCKAWGVELPKDQEDMFEAIAAQESERYYSGND